MTNPQIVRVGGAAGTPPQPQGKIKLLEPDLKMCQRLLQAGIPEDIILDVAEALNKKIEMLDDNSRLVTQNSDLLQANQRLAERVEHYQTEARKLRQEVRVLTETLATQENQIWLLKTTSYGGTTEETKG